MSGPRDRDREPPDELVALGEAPASAEERAQAASLARLTADMLEGRAAPPAMKTDERALLETATALHASLGEAGLAPQREKLLLDAVFGRRDPTAPVIARRPTTIPPARELKRRTRRLGRALPWALAAVSAAAALALWLRTPDPGARGVRPPAPAAALRSTDAVIGGPIPRAQAGDASARLDALVADRRAARRNGGVR